MNNVLTAEQLRELLHYNPTTGVFTWRFDRGGLKAGSVAGQVLVKNNGQRQCRRIIINGKNYYANRLAWLYVYGAWPANHVSHIDGDGLNNCIDNLREATSAENAQTRKLRSDNTSGFTGVNWRKKENKWQARIKLNGKYRSLGLFATPEAAHAAYLAAKADLHTFQPVPRKQVAA
jgi:hypothetical protein